MKIRQSWFLRDQSTKGKQIFYGILVPVHYLLFPLSSCNFEGWNKKIKKSLLVRSPHVTPEGERRLLAVSTCQGVLETALQEYLTHFWADSLQYLTKPRAVLLILSGCSAFKLFKSSWFFQVIALLEAQKARHANDRFLPWHLSDLSLALRDNVCSFNQTYGKTHTQTISQRRLQKPVLARASKTNRNTCECRGWSSGFVLPDGTFLQAQGKLWIPTLQFVQWPVIIQIYGNKNAKCFRPTGHPDAFIWNADENLDFFIFYYYFLWFYCVNAEPAFPLLFSCFL